MNGSAGTPDLMTQGRWDRYAKILHIPLMESLLYESSIPLKKLLRHYEMRVPQKHHNGLKSQNLKSELQG